MSAQKSESQINHAPEQGVLSTSKQAQVDDLLVQMHSTTNPDELVVLAERLKLLAQQPADELHTFDESELPEWSIHEEDQENLNAFFNEPADRGSADAAFTIPRGISGSPEVVLAVHSEKESEETIEETDEGEAEEEVGEVEEQEREQNWGQEQGKDIKQEEEQKQAQEEEQEQQQAQDQAQEKDSREAPRREDFARFHCIYESKDGQLALYEDEHGHLTAVNTNRFV